jgi:hypothetical protein
MDVASEEKKSQQPAAEGEGFWNAIDESKFPVYHNAISKGGPSTTSQGKTDSSTQTTTRRKS